MRPASRRIAQRGFSLMEVVIALILFVLVINVLLNYQRVIGEGLVQQWQYRTIWRLANQQTEIDPPPIEAGFSVIRKVSPDGNCLWIEITITSKSGRRGQLSRLHCPLSG